MRASRCLGNARRPVGLDQLASLLLAMRTQQQVHSSPSVVFSSDNIGHVVQGVVLGETAPCLTSREKWLSSRPSLEYLSSGCFSAGSALLGVVLGTLFDANSSQDSPWRCGIPSGTRNVDGGNALVTSIVRCTPDVRCIWANASRLGRWSLFVPSLFNAPCFS